MSLYFWALCCYLITFSLLAWLIIRSIKRYRDRKQAEALLEKTKLLSAEVIQK